MKKNKYILGLLPYSWEWPHVLIILSTTLIQ